MRQWTTHLISEEANKTTRKIMQKTDKEFKDTRNMFNVPGVIGTVGNDGTNPEFVDYKEFATVICKR